MLEQITLALRDASSSVVALPLAFALGLVSALASACCTLPAMGMLVAYSGTRATQDRRSTVSAALWFLLGNTLALMILGFIGGLAGQTAKAFLGQYWKLCAGVVAVLVGLGTLKLLPLPALSRGAGGHTVARAPGWAGSGLGGLLLGGGVAAASLPCNPGIFIVLGATILMRQFVWGMVLMTAYAIGFSLPLAAILFGVSFGKASVRAEKADAIIRTVAGVALVVAGLSLLGSF